MHPGGQSQTWTEPEGLISPGIGTGTEVNPIPTLTVCFFMLRMEGSGGSGYSLCVFGQGRFRESSYSLAPTIVRDLRGGGNSLGGDLWERGSQGQSGTGS